jgi:hypothetical protein
VKLTRRAPTAEFIGPKKGKMIAKNQMGITTGSLASARRQMLLVSCIPITFSHTKYRGVQANPKVMNWCMSISITAASRYLFFGIREKALEWVSSMSPKAQYMAAADGNVRVKTYRVAIKYMCLNFCGFHIACIISL